MVIGVGHCMSGVVHNQQVARVTPSLDKLSNLVVRLVAGLLVGNLQCSSCMELPSTQNQPSLDDSNSETLISDMVSNSSKASFSINTADMLKLGQNKFLFSPSLGVGITLDLNDTRVGLIRLILSGPLICGEYLVVH